MNLHPIRCAPPTSPPPPAGGSPRAFLRAHIGVLAVVSLAYAAPPALAVPPAGFVPAAAPVLGAALALAALAPALVRPSHDTPARRAACLAIGATALLAAATAAGALASPATATLGLFAGLAATFVGLRAAAALAAGLVVGLAAGVALAPALAPPPGHPAAAALAALAVVAGLLALARAAAAQASAALAHQGAALAAAEAALEGANTALALANTRLAQFSAVVGHDLKSPLQSIVARMDLLALIAPEQPGRAVALSAEVIDTAERMGVQLDEILKLATMGDRLPAALPVPLDAPLAEARADLSPAAAALPVTVAGPLPVAHGSAPLLRQLLQNLLENAAKYGAREVCVAPAPAGPGRIAIAVEDDGPGVDPADRAAIFGLFQRPQKHQRAPGVGAGLAIVQRILEVHGGAIRIEAGERLSGARFVVELPAG